MNVQTEGIPNESTWYGKLYAIRKLKVVATRCMICYKHKTEVAPQSEYDDALKACHDLGLSDEILLERLKV